MEKTLKLNHDFADDGVLGSRKGWTSGFGMR